MKKLKKLIALILIIVMSVISSDSHVMADLNLNPEGIVNRGKQPVGGPILYPGILITVQKVKNLAKGVEVDKQNNAFVGIATVLKDLFQKSLESTYDKDPNVTNGILVTLSAGGNDLSDVKNGYCETLNSTPEKLKYVYSIKRGKDYTTSSTRSTGGFKPVFADKLAQDSSWLGNKMSCQDFYKYANKGNSKSSAESFYKMFSQPKDIGTKFNKAVGNLDSEMTPEKRSLYTARYVEILYDLYLLSNKTMFKDELEEYIRYQNNPKTANYIITVVAQTVISYDKKDGGLKPFTKAGSYDVIWQNYVDAYASFCSNGLTKAQVTQQPKVDYLAKGHLEEYRTAMMEHDKVKSYADIYFRFAWYRINIYESDEHGLDTRSYLVMNDAGGTKTVGAGYTVLVRDISKDTIDYEPELNVGIHASSKSTKINDTKPVDVDVEVNFKSEKNSKEEKALKETLEYAKDNNLKGTITLNLRREVEKGAVKDNKPFDNFISSPLKGSGVPNKDKMTVTLKDITYDNFKDFMSGKKSISIKDTGLLVDKSKLSSSDKKVKLKYVVSAEIKFPEPIKGPVKAEPTGDKKDLTKLEASSSVEFAIDVKPPSTSLNIGIHADSGQEVISETEPATVTSKINFKMKKTSKDYSELMETLKWAKDHNRNVKITLDIKRKTAAGAILDISPYDNIKVSGDIQNTITKDGKTAKVVLKGVTVDNFKDFALGKKFIYIEDSGILLDKAKQLESEDDTVDLQYIVKAKLSYGSEPKENVTGFPTGDEMNYSEMEASSFVSFTYDGGADIEEKQEQPQTGSYYSALKPAYAEIKEGSPDNESFEAMAGVPTTEDLYVGFGAQEFAIGMDTEYKKNPESSRTYTLKYITSKCTDDNEKCTITCTGHTVTKSCGAKIIDSPAGTDSEGHPIPEVSHTCSGASATAKYGETKSVTCECGAVTAVANGTALCPDNKGGCTWHDGKHGCKCSHTVNQSHPRTVTWTGTITQDIDKFSYLSIPNIQLYRLSKCTLDGNPDLLSNAHVEIDPKTGYKVFSAVGDYATGNGRLMFSYNLDDKDRYGNTMITITDSNFMKYEECDKAATQWMNETVKGQEVDATVVSDYCIMQTSEGYDIPSFHTYKSDKVKVTNNKFNEGGENKSITGNKITFSELADWEQLWIDNPYSAYEWDENHLVRSGYNGNYSSPKQKWSNTNYAGGFDPTSVLPNHPAADKLNGSTSFATGVNNQRLTQRGLNIIDSTDTNGNWSDSDNLKPVSNGVWDTGKTKIQYDKVVEKGTLLDTLLFDAKESGSTEIEVGYYEGNPELNDIVIHNPVSTQYATVVPNDKKYDLRTTASLADDKLAREELFKDEGKCPRDSSCPYCVLSCSEYPSPHSWSCYEEINVEASHVGGLNSHVCTDACKDSTSLLPDTKGWAHINYQNVGSLHTCKGIANGCTYCESNLPFHNKDDITPEDLKVSVLGAKALHWSCYNAGSTMHICMYDQQIHETYNSRKCTTCGHTCITIESINEGGCTHELNTHVCTDACTAEIKQKVCICTNPHHYELGQPWRYSDLNNHYEFGDPRCWSPCCDDEKHKSNNHVSVTTSDGKVVDPSDLFINLDREFRIYYPNKGDFAQSTTLHGIASCTDIRGMGYVDDMDTSKWIRNKYITLPVDVIDSTGKCHNASTLIDLNKIPVEGDGYYTFYCVLENSEMAYEQVRFLAIANNALEVEEHDSGNNEATNKLRDPYDCSAKDTSSKKQYIDVVGYIGSLTINDTGDFRFATLFKKQASQSGWLIENLVPKVDYRIPNKLVTDNTNVRQDIISSNTNWQSAYGVTANDIGGKSHEPLLMPLTPAMNPIEALRKQPMRPGYQLYMDVETAGNYYGENFDSSGNPHDSSMIYKMQVTLKYWELDLDTKQYYPVDVYMSSNNVYVPIVKFDETTNDTEECLQYLEWLEEADRRNYMSKEKSVTTDVKTKLSSVGTNREFEDENGNKVAVNEPSFTLRSPIAKPYMLGNVDRLFLNDLTRTFTGSSKTYGENKNPENLWGEEYFARQSQRWHFTVGLPSSVVFIRQGQDCTEENIKALQSRNSVIVCALDIKVKGTVWTLQYNGTNINGKGFKVTEDGPTYNPPIDTNTGKPIICPIVTVYSNKYTAKDDLRTEGSH